MTTKDDIRVLIVNSHNFQSNPERRILQAPLYLGASLKQSGITIKYVDFQLVKLNKKEDISEEKLIERILDDVIEDFNPGYVGISIHYTGAFLNGANIADYVKSKYSQIQIIAGGHHTTVFSELVLQTNPQFDFVLKGESEQTFPKLVQALHHNQDYSSIDGLTYRDGDTIKDNSKVDWIEPVDQIPFPDYSLINVEDYYFDTTGWVNPKGHMINVSFPLLTSRSCPFKCTYCSMFRVQGPQIRLRSPENVVDEIQYYYEEYGQNYFSLIDDNFAYKRKRFIKICDLIKQRGLDIQFDTTNGYDLNFVYEDILAAMIDVGFLRTSVSIESGDETMRLVHMKKPLKQKRIYEAYEVLNKFKKSHNFDFTTLFVIGMPQETHATLKATEQIINDLKLTKIAMGFAIPYPGTQLYDICKRDNLFTISPEEFLVSDFYNHADQVCIKPYELEVDDIFNFRKNIYESLEAFSSSEYIKTAKDNNTISNW